MRRHSRPAAGVLLLLVLFGLLLGCRQEVPPLFRRNQPPETILTVIPEDSAQGYYRYHVWWRGQDSDGRVVRYIFAITDTLSRDEDENWNPERFEDRERSVYTDKSDSIFVFNSARGRQALNISAIDDFGRVDRSPARSFFRIVDSGLPKVRFLAVQGFRAGVTLPPCTPVLPPSVSAQQCTIPTYTSFKIRFTGTSPNGRIVGYQWQRIPPPPKSPGGFEPAGVDSLYLPAGRDSTGFSFAGDTLWTLRGDVVSVFQYNTSPDSSIKTGNYKLRARVKDDARRESLFSDGGELLTAINYDPDTRLERIAAQDCPRCRLPNPPAYCSGSDSIRAFYVVGYDRTAISDSSQWVQHCDGDTIPQLSYMRFFSRGRDDNRDVPAGASLRAVTFSARFSWSAGEPPNELSNRAMPFSIDPHAVVGNYHLPNGAPWHGWVNGWGDPDRFPGACPFNFTYYVASVDENDKRDGTPDSLSFFVSGSPQLDSVQVPLVLVLAPRCSAILTGTCPPLDGITFGPDTVLVVGQHIPDTASPIALGSNRFKLPLRGYGHDHPRDSELLIRPELWGRVRAWVFGFDCADSTCNDLVISGGGQWRDDRLDANVFDDSLPMVLALDSVCTNSPCVGINYKTVLPGGNFGNFHFSLQGRDTNAIGSVCSEPSDLGPTPAEFPRPYSDFGRNTTIANRQVVLRQLQDVRPYVTHAKARAPHRSTRKGWWKR